MKHLENTPQMMAWFLLAPVLVMMSHLVQRPAIAAASSDMASSSPLPIPAKSLGCPSMCGNVSIPFPFGIGDECSWRNSGEFTVNCNNSFSPPRPYAGDLEIMSISLESGEMRLFSPVAYNCNNRTNGVAGWSFNLANTPLLISPNRNVFMAIGCNTLAFIGGREDRSFLTGCITTCTSLHDAAQDGDDCTGLGCCQTGIPANLSTITVGWKIDENSVDDVNPIWSPCSYAFVSEKGWYHFERQDLTRIGNKSFTDRVGDRTIPVVLDWAFRNDDDGSCQPLTEDGESSPKAKAASACVSANSYCVNATHRNGYLCNCSKGYQGNPYVHGGCQNINECELRKTNPAEYDQVYPCHSSSTCQDTPGDYKCKCKFGHRGDGKSDKGCQPIVPGYAVAIVATFVSVVLAACFAVVLLQRREHRNRFNKNGGDILKNMGINIFTEAEVKKITNGDKIKLGAGSFGEVYKGTIKGTQQVAVKRCSKKKKEVARSWQKILRHEAPQHEQDASWKDGFVEEITFQIKIRHTNMVRLLGCCLETDIPILIFEFIPNGSLHDMLHGADDKRHALSLLQRLDIAIGSAEALSHMHTHGEHRHVHGDVKSSNILLDRDLQPKVSDFGSSKLLSVNSYYANCVLADRSYMDPVYYRTGRFTVKSDVYSFGVVLLELITGKPARYGDSCLTIDFHKCCKAQGNGREMYVANILSDDDAESQCYMECLDMVGALAIRCLKEDVEDRPTMLEVFEELKQAKLVASGGSCKEATT